MGGQPRRFFAWLPSWRDPSRSIRPVNCRDCPSAVGSRTRPSLVPSRLGGSVDGAALRMGIAHAPPGSVEAGEPRRPVAAERLDEVLVRGVADVATGLSPLAEVGLQVGPRCAAREASRARRGGRPCRAPQPSRTDAGPAPAPSRCAACGTARRGAAGTSGSRSAGSASRDTERHGGRDRASGRRSGVCPGSTEWSSSGLLPNAICGTRMPRAPSAASWRSSCACRVQCPSTSSCDRPARHRGSSAVAPSDRSSAASDAGRLARRWLRRAACGERDRSDRGGRCRV